MNGNAQNVEVSSLSGTKLTLRIGASQLITEMPYNLSGAINEFNNDPGIGYSFELSKNLSDKLDIGVELSNSTLTGKNDLPSFSAIGFHSAMMNLINEPVLYRNFLSTNKIFIQYSFLRFAGSKVNYKVAPFVRAGAGYLTYKSEFNYEQNSENGIIFGKNYDEYINAKTSNAVYFIATGFNLSLSPKIDLSTIIKLNFVNYDFFDVVHNYDNNGNRLNLVGIFSDFMVGVSYRFSKIEGAGRNVKTAKNKKSTPPVYLPWYKHFGK